MSLSHALPAFVTADYQVRQALSSLGLDVEIVRSVAMAAAAGRAEALDVDPVSAPGILSYIRGVRATRLLLLPQGWRQSRTNNVESVVNDRLGIQICYQNVDRACSIADPQAVSGKGAGARDMVNAGQRDLFDPVPGETGPVPLGRTPEVWFLCVSSDDHSVQAEVSCPRSFEGNQFEGFVHRIVVINEHFELDPLKSSPPQDDDMDFPINVTKKA
jgi:hypothetical protein